jgi:hypothetical protein
VRPSEVEGRFWVLASGIVLTETGEVKIYFHI